MLVDDALRVLEARKNELRHERTVLNDNIEIAWLLIGTPTSEYQQSVRDAGVYLEYIERDRDMYLNVRHIMYLNDPLAEVNVQIHKLTAEAVECEEHAAKLWRWNPYKKRLLERAVACRDDATAFEDMRSRVPDVLREIADIESRMQDITTELQRVTLCIMQKKEHILKEAMEDCE